MKLLSRFYTNSRDIIEINEPSQILQNKSGNIF